MPMVVRCAECGFVLAEMDLLSSFTEEWYAIVFEQHKGKCPKCGHKLPTPGAEFRTKMEVQVTANPATEDESPLASTFKHDYHRRRARVLSDGKKRGVNLS